MSEIITILWWGVFATCLLTYSLIEKKSGEKSRSMRFYLGLTIFFAGSISAYFISYPMLANGILAASSAFGGLIMGQNFAHAGVNKASLPS